MTTPLTVTVPDEVTRRILAAALRAHRVYIGGQLASLRASAKAKDDKRISREADVDALEALLTQVDGDAWADLRLCVQEAIMEGLKNGD